MRLMSPKFVVVILLAVTIFTAASFGARTFMALPTQNITLDFPGLQVASIEDPTRSTGATLFYFANGATAQVDIRGGSAATSETNLLDPGSYSSQIDGIVIAGGSTMGLAAGDGVRDVIFKRRSGQEATFNSIPSVPTAVIYDFGKARFEPNRDKLVYPDSKLGAQLMSRLSNTFVAGRAGAGVSATANKLNQRVWGGQGYAVRDLGFAKVAAAVVVNAMGDLSVPGLKPIAGIPNARAQHGENTTISVIITDAKLSRDQLKRLGITVHTSMSRSIFPFHTEYDGDSLFSVSTSNRAIPATTETRDYFLELLAAAADTMKEAIETAARVANSQN